MSLLLVKKESKREQMLEILKKTHCFSNLDKAALLVLAKAFKPKTFKAGKRIYTEGNIGDR